MKQGTIAISIVGDKIAVKSYFEKDFTLNQLSILITQLDILKRKFLDDYEKQLVKSKMEVKDG